MNDLLSGTKILVVEDEMLVLMDMEDMLADLGCKEISSAATVEAALALVNSEKFDIALLDMNLDGEKTNLIAESLLESGVKFAFATGYNVNKSASEQLQHPVLTKPIRPGELAHTLSRLIRNA